MSNEMIIRKALVGGLNFDGVLGEDYLFKGNMIEFGRERVDITDAMVSKGMQYIVEKLAASIEVESRHAGVAITGCEAAKAIFAEGMARALCALYSMGEQNGAATDREMAAQRARGSSGAEVEVIEVQGGNDGRC